MTAGSLHLMPNALDLGTPAVAMPLDEVLPHGVIRTAARLGFWIAENAKSARLFLKRVDAVVPLGRPLQEISIVELPRPAKGALPAGGHPAPAHEAWLAPMHAGHDVGLISEAGLPAVADPGAAVVAAAHAAGLRVIAQPGPSSLLLALAASGLNGQNFAFIGYLPVEAALRAARLRELEALSKRHAQTQLAIETPYRNAALLAALLGTLQATTRLSISCGLTSGDGWSLSDSVGGWRQRATQMPGDVPAVFAWLAS